MAILAAYPAMMQRDRKREGSEGMSRSLADRRQPREYREIEAGDRTLSLDTYERISELYGWPQAFAAQLDASADSNM